CNLNLIDRNHICFNHNLNAHHISTMKLHFDIVTQLLQSMRQEIELKDNRMNNVASSKHLIKSLEENNSKLNELYVIKGNNGIRYFNKVDFCHLRKKKRKGQPNCLQLIANQINKITNLFWSLQLQHPISVKALETSNKHFWSWTLKIQLLSVLLDVVLPSKNIEINSQNRYYKKPY
ncbi:hypothetical protein RFI_38538, partial [Reticulomyxa filosa]